MVIAQHQQFFVVARTQVYRRTQRVDAAFYPVSLIHINLLLITPVRYQLSSSDPMTFGSIICERELTNHGYGCFQVRSSRTLEKTVNVHFVSTILSDN